MVQATKQSAPLREPSIMTKFFSAGTAACMADLITFPLDTAKVRLQIQGEGGVKSEDGKAVFKYRGMFGTIRTMWIEEGPRTLYSGIVPGLQRQMAFASVRIGLYEPVKRFYFDLFEADELRRNVALRILAGVTTGGMAVACAQPTDVVKVRLQAQGTTRKAAVVRYTGSIHAYQTIAKEEGVKGLWKGTLPNIARNSIVNAAELVSYDLIKETILRHKLMTDNMPCHFVSAFGAGFITTVVASPVDVVKTRFMNSPKGKYRGAIHCAVNMFREGGFWAFYKGFVPSYMRLGSWNIFMFVFFEQIKRLAVRAQDYYRGSDNSSTEVL